MTVREAMREIESHEFAARLNVASNFRTFLRAAQRQEAVRTLLQELDSQEKRQQVFFRILELSRQRVDPRYENQWDTALAVYVWLINLKDFDLAKVAAEAAAQALQCWWAMKVSGHILLGSLTHSNAGVEQREVTSSSSISARETQASDVGEVILFGSFLSEMAKMVVVQANADTRLSLRESILVTDKWSSQQSDYWVLPRNTDSKTVLEERRML